MVFIRAELWKRPPSDIYKQYRKRKLKTSPLQDEVRFRLPSQVDRKAAIAIWSLKCKFSLSIQRRVSVDEEEAYRLVYTREAEFPDTNAGSGKAGWSPGMIPSETPLVVGLSDSKSIAECRLLPNQRHSKSPQTHRVANHEAGKQRTATLNPHVSLYFPAVVHVFVVVFLGVAEGILHCCSAGPLRPRYVTMQRLVVVIIVAVAFVLALDFSFLGWGLFDLLEIER